MVDVLVMETRCVFIEVDIVFKHYLGCASRFQRIKYMLCFCHTVTVVRSRIRLELPCSLIGTVRVIISDRVRLMGHAAHMGQDRLRTGL